MKDLNKLLEKFERLTEKQYQLRLIQFSNREGLAEDQKLQLEALSTSLRRMREIIQRKINEKIWFNGQ